MNYNQLQLDLEALEGGLEQMSPEKSSTAHFVRMELANTLAHARELVEALANDEQWELKDEETGR